MIIIIIIIMVIVIEIIRMTITIIVIMLLRTLLCLNQPCATTILFLSVSVCHFICTKFVHPIGVSAMSARREKPPCAALFAPFWTLQVRTVSNLVLLELDPRKSRGPWALDIFSPEHGTVCHYIRVATEPTVRLNFCAAKCPRVPLFSHECGYVFACLRPKSLPAL